MMVHNNNLIKSSLVAAVSALLTSSPVFAASISNGDFEANAIPGNNIEGFSVPGTDQNGFVYASTGNSLVTNWTVITGNEDGGISYLGNQIFNNNGALSRTVQLNGQSRRGGIATTVSGLTTGDNVSVFFDLSGNPNSVPTAPNGQDSSPVIPTVLVALQNAGLAQSFTLGVPPSFTAGVGGAFRNLSFTNFVANFVYTGQASTATLSFTSQSGQNLGPIIDNVSLTPIPFEFSPVSGFIVGGVLFGASKLIKRNKSVV